MIILGRFGVCRVKERSCGLCSRMIRKTEDYSVLRIAYGRIRLNAGDACLSKGRAKSLCLVGEAGSVHDYRIRYVSGVDNDNALARGSPSRSVGVTGAGCRIITVIKSGDVKWEVEG